MRLPGDARHRPNPGVPNFGNAVLDSKVLYSHRRRCKNAEVVVKYVCG
jgi:hypothetical protein